MSIEIRHGLRQNWQQFSLLVLVNAFVGAMIGLERAVMPGFAETVFQKQGQVVLLSFIGAFGIAKAFANLAMASLSKKYSRKMLLVAGWLLAIPVPFLLIYAESWSMVVVANILLGLNQGLAWSSTVIMKVDLVGEKNRGLAMGINEFAGYVSVGLAAYLASWLATEYGYQTAPFIPGIIFSFLGLLITLIWIHDTGHHVKKESVESRILLLENVFIDTSYRHKTIGTVTINGLVNNMNDGVIWGLLPVLLINKGFSLTETGMLAGLYPAVWGLAQLFTGKLGDTHCKKQLISTGMLMQAAGILILVIAPITFLVALSMILLGLGTALVYPNFLSMIANHSHPSQRAASLSIFRFWRDSGYVFGALVAGFTAAFAGIPATLILVAIITAAAGLLSHFRMCCTNKTIWKETPCLEIY
ncbi:MFS transporter [Flavihumibacter sediminis]|nr:MFS transporter [Flavihumibacter sediminis]